MGTITGGARCWNGQCPLQELKTQNLSFHMLGILDFKSDLELIY